MHLFALRFGNALPYVRQILHVMFILILGDVHGDAVAQWSDHSLAVRKFPGSNLVRTSPVHPAVKGFLKGYPISDSA